jgi:hypothetical protein
MPVYKLTIEGNDTGQLRMELMKLASAFQQVPTSVHVSAEPVKTEIISARVTCEPVTSKVMTPKVHNESINSDINKSDADTKPETKNAEIPLVALRALLARLTQEGRSTDVVAALQKFGCARLTDLPAKHYHELLTNLGVAHD